MSEDTRTEPQRLIDVITGHLVDMTAQMLTDCPDEDELTPPVFAAFMARVQRQLAPLPRDALVALIASMATDLVMLRAELEEVPHESE